MKNTNWQPTEVWLETTIFKGDGKYLFIVDNIIYTTIDGENFEQVGEMNDNMFEPESEEKVNFWDYTNVEDYNIPKEILFGINKKRIKLQTAS